MLVLRHAADLQFSINITRIGSVNKETSYAGTVDGTIALLLPETRPPEAPRGRLPRITRLMAMAIHFEGLIQSGAVTKYAELARLGNVTRARVTQIMNLLLLAPEIQEELLFLPRLQEGRGEVCLRDLQAVAAVMVWREQQHVWRTRSQRP